MFSYHEILTDPFLSDASLGYTVPKVVQLIVLLLYLWTTVGCTYIVLCSITRLLIYGCICGFWTSLSSSGGGGWLLCSSFLILSLYLVTAYLHFLCRNTNDISWVSIISSFVKYYAGVFRYILRFRGSTYLLC